MTSLKKQRYSTVLEKDLIQDNPVLNFKNGHENSGNHATWV